MGLPHERAPCFEKGEFRVQAAFASAGEGIGVGIGPIRGLWSPWCVPVLVSLHQRECPWRDEQGRAQFGWMVLGDGAALSLGASRAIRCCSAADAPTSPAQSTRSRGAVLGAGWVPGVVLHPGGAGHSFGMGWGCCWRAGHGCFPVEILLGKGAWVRAVPKEGHRDAELTPGAAVVLSSPGGCSAPSSQSLC